MDSRIRLTNMRGDERIQDGMFSYVRLEQRVPEDHPLRAVRKLTDQVLRSLSPGFDELYAASGRPSIAPEYILRALLLQVFYSIRSERLLVEQIDYNLLFRWFVGLGMDDAVWNHAVFSKNRDRLLTSAVAQQFFSAVNRRAKRFMSDEHFTVDGTLIQAWASQKSFRSKDGSGDGGGSNFRGQKRTNKTHESTTDADARLYKKSYGKESKLSYLGHALVENRNGLIAAAMVTLPLHLPPSGCAALKAVCPRLRRCGRRLRMKWLRTICREILGLFVDDGSFAVAILVWLGVVWILSRHLGPGSVLGTVTLSAGLVLILVESAVRFAKHRRRPS